MTQHLEVWTPGATRLVPLDTTRLTVGRHPDSDIVLTDPEASAVHALLEAVGGGWSVRDLNSSNGTYVNGARIVGERLLRHGDEIRAGRTRLVFRGQRDDAVASTVVATQRPEVTRRERDVLLALFGGRIPNEMFFEPTSTREMAASLGVSVAAIKQHLLHLYDKFGLTGEAQRNRARLANDAMRLGVITVADLVAAAAGD